MGTSVSTNSERFIDFVAAGISPFHVKATVEHTLIRQGFSTLRVEDTWNISAHGTYVTEVGDGSLIAVKTGSLEFVKNGLVVLAAHGDSPTLMVKERAVDVRHGYLCMPTELYGGPIVPTWLDRELGVAGRCVDNDGVSHAVDLPLRVVIPNLAVHLNRKVNQGFAYNAQDHLVAIAGTGEAPEKWLAALVETASGTSSDVWESDLMLYDPSPVQTVGRDGKLVVGPRIDDLVGVFTNLETFLDYEGDRTVVMVLYNHEEVGSLTGEGAHSGALTRFLARLAAVVDGTPQAAELCAARSLLISNDVAHALHPSYSDKYDPKYAPVLGGGPVLKMSGILKYATTARTGIVAHRAAEKADVSLQRLAMRSDMRPGSTVGPASWARTGIATVDVGVGLIAMHSIRETASTDDIDGTISLLAEMIEEA